MKLDPVQIQIYMTEYFAISDETASFTDKEANLKSSKSPTPVCNKETMEVESIVITDKIKAKKNHWIEN